MQLLFKLSPSQKLIQKILKFNQETELDEIFLIKTPYEAMYKIILMISLLCDCSSEEISIIRQEFQITERKVWIKHFLSNGGPKWVINQLKKFKKRTKHPGVIMYLITLLELMGIITVCEINCSGKIEKNLKFCESEAESSGTLFEIITNEIVEKESINLLNYRED